MAAELPGTAFLQRRLARAQSVAPAERSPEVQAFITSVELGRQICELLPLLQDVRGGGEVPQPALPLGDPDTARRAMRAALLLVQADYVCPEPAIFSPDCFLHLEAYMPALQQAAETLQGSCQYLARALCAYVRLCRLSDLQAEKWHLFIAALSAAMTQCSGTIGRQLERLMGEQPASQASINMIAQQLQCACHALLVGSVPAVLRPSGPGAAQQVPAESTVAAARQRLQDGASAWLQLEPDRLNAVARTALAFSTRRLRQSDQASLDRVLRALRLAQQQRSPYWIVLTAAAAALLALGSTVQASQLRTVVDSFGAVEPALRSCKRLLPHVWVDGLDAAYQAAAAGMPALRSRLAASAFVRAVPANLEGMREVYSVLQRRMQEDASQCAGCGLNAVGLRACARCRAVRYCSPECQAAHWPQHRRQCRPA